MNPSLKGSGTFRLDSWELTPEGAAIHRGERTAVIADVHLGYEWARGAAGDCVPAHSLVETIGRLERVLSRAAIARLIVAGDLVESPRPCRRTAADLRTMMSERGNYFAEIEAAAAEALAPVDYNGGALSQGMLLSVVGHHGFSAPATTVAPNKPDTTSGNNSRTS